MEFTPQAKRAFHMQSYGPGPSIDGVELVELKRFADDAGTLTELARLTDGRAAAFAGFALRQINYSELSPGAIKAFHLHTRQTDIWYEIGRASCRERVQVSEVAEILNSTK